MAEISDSEKKDSPSFWYGEAKNTLVYTLSELVFGSLLASFILGFIGFSSSVLLSTNDGLTPAIDNGTKLIKVATYLCVSGIYTYYTAGLYLFYHTGILTMPTFNLKSASRDFSLSLLSAVAFGLSMLWPQFLMLLLSIIIFCSLFIQHSEHQKLVKTLYDDLNNTKPAKKTRPGSNNKYDVEKINNIKGLLKKSKLDGWRNSTGWVWCWAIILLSIGIAVVVVDEYNLYPIEWNRNNTKSKILLAFSFVLFLFLFFNLRKVFGVASTFTNNESDDNYDKAYDELKTNLSKI